MARRMLRGFVLGVLLAAGILAVGPAPSAQAQGYIWQVRSLGEQNFNVVPTPAAGVMWMVPAGAPATSLSLPYDATNIGVPPAAASGFVLGIRYGEILSATLAPAFRRPPGP
jgi:hypothetical protein